MPTEPCRWPQACRVSFSVRVLISELWPEAVWDKGSFENWVPDNRGIFHVNLTKLALVKYSRSRGSIPSPLMAQLRTQSL